PPSPPAPAPAARAAPPTIEPVAPDVAVLEAGLARTRGGFVAKLRGLFSRERALDPALLEDIEEVLITADIGVRTSQRILDELRARMDRGALSDADKVWRTIHDEAREILTESDGAPKLTETPSLVLVVGVNGVGKTTTIGKLASRFRAEGKQVLLVAGDTFRAAAVQQLEIWGERVGCTVVRGKDGADPSSVLFDAIRQGQRDGVDLILADTAGRLHTKAPLMAELEKLGRTAEKALGRPADEVWLVLDATTGQNAIQQAKLFKEALPVSGVVLTKLDGTAKGGVILGIVDEHHLPVRFIGIGEKVEDLRAFDAATFVDALFAPADDHRDRA
ncbi:MAG: signal recognition particle-docking protein FtsY, partial [Myxococcales bacterium]|nr:signal recognition particle-docking protein FtsY [Myxococcales bacterium]